jgi:inosose dehydratase
MAQNGVQMAYHYHMGTVVQTETDILKLLALTGDSVGLLLDTGHLAYAGGNLETILLAGGKRINHVHCKDVRPSVLADALNRDRPFLSAVLDGVFAIPGEGMVDFEKLFDGLKQQSYQGWLVIEAEQDQSVAPAFDCARRGYEFLEKMSIEKGLLTVT